MYGVTGMQAELGASSGDPGPTGPDGLSAYDVAVANGFVGDEAAWLASLVGAPGADGAQGPQGDPGPAGADGDPGAPGVDGLSAYDIAVNAGFIGDEVAWLASLVGPQGDPGPAGADGADGESAYEVAVANGFVGDEAAWLASLVGATGATGATGPAGANGPVTISGKTGAYTVVAGDLGAVINCTANTFTVSLTAAATLGAGFRCWVWNTSNTSTHVITIDPAGSETIDGATTLLLRRGEGFEILCDGTNWQTAGTKKQRLYSENAANNATRPVVSGSNACAFGPSSQATATSAVSVGDGAISTGTSAVAIGTSRASDTDSLAIAITNNTTTYGSSVSSAVSIGYLAASTATYAITLGGYALTATGNGSAVIGGFSNAASGQYAASLGGNGNSANGPNSAVIGGAYGSANYVTGKVVFPSVHAVTFTVYGSAQAGLLTLGATTSSATPVVMSSSGVSINTGNQLVLQNFSSMAVTGRVIAQRKGSESTTSTAMWTFNAVIRRGANAASTALVAAVTPTLIAADADAAAWTVAVSADTTNGALAVTATGEAGKNIRWVCTLESTETIYS